MKLYGYIFLALLILGMDGPVFSHEQDLDRCLAKHRLHLNRGKARALKIWKPLIQRYSYKHYGENTWQLKPTSIVLHYTAGAGFPDNLVTSTEYGGETPGLASHFVVDRRNVWQILPPRTSLINRRTSGRNWLPVEA